MKNLFNKIKNNRKLILILLGIFVVLAIIVIKDKNREPESFSVEKTNISQSVVLSGKVMTIDKADLGFAASGRIGNIFVKNNQTVNKGDTLVQLEIGELLAELKIKQANSRTSDIDLQAAKDDLDKVIVQENTKVENAYRTLLTEGLEFIPNSTSYTVDAPSLGGLYNGGEGQYKVRIERETTTSSDFTLRTFGLEKTEKTINEEGSTALGTKGLYISFPDDLDSYDDTLWFLDIPNKTSSVYLSNYNAYNEAKNNRDIKIKDAEVEYQKLLTEDDGGLSVAQAEIDKIRAEIKKNTINAPFTGKVTNIEKEIGETVSIGETVISILGEEKLEVVLQVSELDVSKIIPGAEIKITLDAFIGEEFNGILKTINSRDTEIDGVPVYEAFVELPSDIRIKTGMSANGTITLAKREDVLAIPLYLIEKIGESNFVEVVLANGNTEKREIVLGLVGTDNMVEILSGLQEGEKIIISDIAK